MVYGGSQPPPPALRRRWVADAPHVPPTRSGGGIRIGAVLAFKGIGVAF